MRVCFNHFLDNETLSILQLEPITPIVFYNEELDFAVLQLEGRLPAPLRNPVGDVNESATLHLIGHSGGSFKSCALSCERCPLDHPDVNPGVLSPDWPLFKSSFKQGASGSPGFNDHGNLVVMLTGGLGHGDEFIFCRGVSIMAVCRVISRERPNLLTEFGWTLLG